MCKHVFGNSPSSAIATYRLRKAVSVDPSTSEEVVNFVNKNFYVDDGLLSTTTPEKAVEIMKKTQAALLTGGNLRLHKVRFQQGCCQCIPTRGDSIRSGKYGLKCHG